ncbi:MAG: His/Gly/Thr/Pro-type tRNA ligase C-terminal domain-containing protein, partial [Methanobacteriaceae archaeon]|nr:His/Gly/Thr/Pro-type tRNA ligase C-terminal domain-containing protein [Methanobacteriaceae archaeon]
VAFDGRGNIGKRYFSQDEIGTILTVTVDFQTIEDKTITLRDRDTTKQIRLPIIELQETIKKIIEGEKFLKFGKLVK